MAYLSDMVVRSPLVDPRSGVSAKGDEYIAALSASEESFASVCEQLKAELGEKDAAISKAHKAHERQQADAQSRAAAQLAQAVMAAKQRCETEAKARLRQQAEAHDGQLRQAAGQHEAALTTLTTAAAVGSIPAPCP